VADHRYVAGMMNGQRGMRPFAVVVVVVGSGVGSGGGPASRLCDSSSDY
jgi:hypothetical protein